MLKREKKKNNSKSQDESKSSDDSGSRDSNSESEEEKIDTSSAKPKELTEDGKSKNYEDDEILGKHASYFTVNNTNKNDATLL